DMGLSQQILIVNGIFTASDSQDALAKSLAAKSLVALRDLPPILRELPVYSVPLMPFNTVGLQALRDLVAPIPRLQGLSASSEQGLAMLKPSLSLQVMAHELATQQRGLVMVMGKGGVGKTTIAAALAVAIAKSGHQVHLSTTDPAAHLAQTIESVLPNLTISRIDPKKETADYCQKILDAKGKTLDSDGIAMLKEDLASPCTEEVAVFHAFARTVFEARRGIVILDTAPTGHTLLLLDAAGSYHREILKKYEESSAGNLRTPLMMLQDSSFAKILLVTLAEATPITEAAALQSDLRRAGIEPYGWVVNRSLAASRTSDDLLRHRAVNEAEQMQRINRGLAKRLAILPLLEEEPIGPDKLLQLLRTEAK
ncbi:MAG: arsenical pump-driving ATPase, partial [Proteobacteria bacterium]|nr:arsenical pump-driving ATPase [Pseudomonadota bacterium]